ncbi:glycosyltransferase family 2 protein [Dyadobacter crusticola]|uniref:glycosyltransferase family 2 protein n=1 Tax=Dyadobacter crusticola TaxID=292407 RepID=UPI0004E207E5|nr:glycosyltransferase family 2 protein [Dyadobacter crusticola]
MDNQPILTIITVTYNAEEYVERTLRSVQVALSHVADPALIEYLIIDGLSTDATLSICQQYSSIISRIVSEKDRGIYDAMNKGIRLANGQYLWFLNAGDEIFDKTVLAGLLIATASKADIYYSDAMMVDENSREHGLRSQFTPHTLPENIKWTDFALGMKICHQAFIARKQVVPFYDISNLSADIDWEIMCLKRAGNAQFLPFILCRYLMGGTSVQNHGRSLVDRFLVLQKHFGTIRAALNHLRIFWRGAVFALRRGKYW